jgi:hypothetical protein
MNTTRGRKGKEEIIPAARALIMLGCPQIPIQTSAALYLAARLKEKAIVTTIAGTKAARALLEVADPDRCYLTELIDLDACIELLAEAKADYDICFVFVHNDAGITYTATVAALTQGSVFSVLFGDDTDTLAAGMTEISSETVIAPGSHNPLNMKRKLDRVMEWVVLKH